MVDITIVNGLYKTTNITGGHHIVYTVYTVIVTVNDDRCDDFGSSVPRCFETRRRVG